MSLETPEVVVAFPSKKPLLSPSTINLLSKHAK